MFYKWIQILLRLKFTKITNMFSNQITLKNAARMLIALVFMVACLLSAIISLDFKSRGTFTVILDVRKDTEISINSYLLLHPWRNASSIVDIRDKLGFNHQWKADVENCPELPESLQGKISAQPFLHDFTTLEDKYPDMHARLKPKNCRSKEKLAIIVPFRDREHHLLVLLDNLIPFLERQQRDVTIVVVNQAPLSKFNRAILFNIGFLEASRIHPFDCFIFHDVDLLPLDDRNLYACEHYPRHMSVAIDKFRFRKIGPEAFGGVVSFTREQFHRINGASNLYYGWGGEDDDLWRRVHGAGMVVVRYPSSVSRYSMIKHGQDRRNDKNPDRHKLLDTSVQRMYKDGLNTLVYKRLGVQVTKLFVWIDVEVEEGVNRKAALAKGVTNAPPTFLRCCHYGMLMSKRHTHGQQDLSRSSFENVLSEENRERVQKKLKIEVPVRTEDHVPLKPNHGTAAVLVPLCTVNGEPSLLLTLRSRKLVKYRGHVSFPGGIVDASDPDVEYTALRETHEELGIEPSAFTIWGHMNNLPASQDGGISVHPILASTGEVDVSKLNISDEEVEEAFTVSIDHLCNPNNSYSTRFRSRRSYTLPVYVGGPHRIWGLTAVITHMLLNMLVPDFYKFKLRHKRDQR